MRLEIKKCNGLQKDLNKTVNKEAVINLLRDKSCDYCSGYRNYNSKGVCWTLTEKLAGAGFQNIPDERTCDLWRKK